MSLALVLVLAAQPEPAPATEVPAPAAEVPAPAAEVDHAARAGQLFRDGEYAEAAAAFELAYERTRDPALLFGRAQALRRAGNCTAAIEVFEAFIATHPPEPDVQAASDVIEACRAILGEDGLPAEPAPEPIAEPAAPPTDDVSPPARRDVLGGVLVGIGAGMVVGGAVPYGLSFGRARGPVEPETEQAYEQRQRSVRTLAATGVSVMIGGGALLVGGVVRYVIVARRSGRRMARASVLGRSLDWRF